MIHPGSDLFLGGFYNLMFCLFICIWCYYGKYGRVGYGNYDDVRYYGFNCYLFLFAAIIHKYVNPCCCHDGGFNWKSNWVIYYMSLIYVCE